jgi:hypothetical protein
MHVENRKGWAEIKTNEEEKEDKEYIQTWSQSVLKKECPTPIQSGLPSSSLPGTQG